MFSILLNCWGFFHEINYYRTWLIGVLERVKKNKKNDKKKQLSHKKKKSG